MKVQISSDLKKSTQNARQNDQRYSLLSFSNEKNVILGAEKVIDKIKGIQLELSFDELYKGETLFFNMVEFMKTKNFNICHITPEFSDPDTDRLLQVDTIFFRD